MTDNNIIVVITNLPDRQVAHDLARSLIEDRLAACVNILEACSSVYRWEGQIETAQEVPVLIKTTEQAYSRVEDAIIRIHPYQLPEIIALPVVFGLPQYLNWVREETCNQATPLP